MQLLVDCLGDGDVGETHQLAEGTTVRRSSVPYPCAYLSIFGELDVKRYVYSSGEGRKILFAAVDAAWPCRRANFPTSCRIGIRTSRWKNPLPKSPARSKKSWDYADTWTAWNA